MRLADPLFLALLLLLPLLFLVAKETGGKFKYSSLHHLKKLTGSSLHHPKKILLAIRLLLLILIVIALARPQSGKSFSEITSEGVDILLAVDTSGSMQALDFKLDDKPVTRLEVVKNVVADFVKKRPRDRIGLVVFGEEAFTQCPLTLDHGILLDFLKTLEIGMAGDATAVGSAIGISVHRMKDLKAKSKIVVLLTDGRNNAGRIPPSKAAELAKNFGIKVYTIGVGTEGQAPFLVETVFGKRYVYQDVDLDETTLRHIANTTDAHYYRATDTDELKKIYEEIDALETTEVKVKEYTEYHEKFPLFLLPAMLLLLLEMMLAYTKLRTIP